MSGPTLIDLAGGHHDLRIRWGLPIRLPIAATDPDGVPVDLTGATIAAAIKASFADETPLVEFAGEAGTETNEYVLNLSAEDAALLPVPTGYNKTKLVWDAKLIWPDGSVDAIYYGYVDVLPGVAP